jgi:hypothetical protein
VLSAGWIQTTGVQLKLEPYWCIWCTKNLQKHIRIDKVMASQIRGVKNSKRKTTEHYKFGFQTPEKLFVSCFGVIRVQK